MKTRIRQLTEQEKRSLGEQQMIADWLQLFPKGILSIVADTFDLWKLITEYLPANKEAIMARDGKLVIRPDSGNPVDIICGTTKVATKLHETPFDVIYNGKYYIDRGGRRDIYHLEKSLKDIKPAEKGVIELLWDIFGGTINEQGYKVLDPHIGAIYGDSITPERQVQIYERLAAKGFAATNIVLGVGSYTYQYTTRDWASMAAKGAWFEVETDKIEKCDFDFTSRCTMGRCNCPKVKKSYNIYKDPVTDDGTKKSLKGLIAVFENRENQAGGLRLEIKQECTFEQESKGLLQIIYENGKFPNETTFKEIRERLKQN